MPQLQNGAFHVFTGNGAAPGQRMAPGIRHLVMRTNAGGGATFTWQISYDRDAAANDGAATWDNLTEDSVGTVASYALGASDSRVVEVTIQVENLWVRCVLSNFVGGSAPSAGIR
jgi:hypothetical protein